MGKRIRKIFVTGILLLVPLLATIEILLWFFQTIDLSFRRFLPVYSDSRGLGVLFAVSLTLLVGFLGQNFLGKWISSWLDRILGSLPVVGGLYAAIKKFLESVLSPGGDQFHGVVLVQFPREGIYSIGFRTGVPDKRLVIRDQHLVNVFVPCTPNPTSGFYLLVAEEQLIPLDLSVQEAFKILLSMGMISEVQ